MKLKANNTTYILLAVVLGIWGVFVVSFVNDLNPGDSQVELSLGTVSTGKRQVQPKAVFELVDTPRDPFLNTNYTAQAKKTTTKTRVTNTAIVWPNIQYKGQIKSGSSKNTVFVLAINGLEHILKAGSTASEVKIVQGSNQQVRLQFKGQIKTFELQ